MLPPSPASRRRGMECRSTSWRGFSPGAKRFFTPSGPDASGPLGVKNLFAPGENPRQLVERHSIPRRRDAGLGGNMEDIPSLEVAGGGHSVIRLEERRIVTEERVDLLFAPDIE